MLLQPKIVENRIRNVQSLALPGTSYLTKSSSSNSCWTELGSGSYFQLKIDFIFRPTCTDRVIIPTPSSLSYTKLRSCIFYIWLGSCRLFIISSLSLSKPTELYILVERTLPTAQAGGQEASEADHEDAEDDDDGVTGLGLLCWTAASPTADCEGGGVVLAWAGVVLLQGDTQETVRSPHTHLVHQLEVTSPHSSSSPC